MIQPIKSLKSVWQVHWVDLEEPVPTGSDWFLPTLVVVCDRNGSPVAPPEIMEELDQARIENLISRTLEKNPPPEQLLIPQNSEWIDEEWRSFSEEIKVDIRFVPSEKSVSDELRAVTRLVLMRDGRPEKALPPPNEVASGLVRTALRVRSGSKKAASLRAALEVDPECTSARIELADLEFAAGNWKACSDFYSDIIRRDANLRTQKNVRWWSDRETRPYLRAVYGLAMTDWHLGRYHEACAGLEDLLACNPVDNQGARFFIPMLYLLTENPEKASKYFQRYEKDYQDDFKEPSFLFGWALACSLEGNETEAKKKYTEGILKNLHIAPMLLECPEPPRNIWFPNDRAEPNYASDFIQSYAVLWDKEPGALRLLREVWNETLPRIEKIVRHRELMMDLQDQRYAPNYKIRWQEMMTEDDCLTTP